MKSGRRQDMGIPEESLSQRMEKREHVRERCSRYGRTGVCTKMEICEMGAWRCGVGKRQDLNS